MKSEANGCCSVTRRGFLLGSGIGLMAGIPSLAWFYARSRSVAPPEEVPPAFTGRSVEIPRPTLAMPGPFPGRVVEVRHAEAVNDNNTINQPVVQRMMDRGMCALTGAEHPSEAWRRLFEKDDVVGIKVNPVGRKPAPGRIKRRVSAPAISSPEVLLEVVAGLKSAGVPARNIIVFERYAQEFRDAGYEKVLLERSMEGVRWYASATAYSDLQVDIEGCDDRSLDRDPHVVGYDPDVFIQQGYALPATPHARGHDPKDDRRFRSHLSIIVTRMVNKFVTIPVLKDHASAGITLALKNLSHGLNNNVARTHIAQSRRRGDEFSGPNQCNTFIPTAAGQKPIREKATLHVLDGLIGVYEGGPQTNKPQTGTWRRRSLFFATDPVAMDHVGWDIIDAKRVEQGWPPVARMGHLFNTPAQMLSPRLAVLSGLNLPQALTGAAVAAHFPTQKEEAFDRRQPEHVILAGTCNLGVFDARQIEHRVIPLG